MLGKEKDGYVVELSYRGVKIHRGPGLLRLCRFMLAQGQPDYCDCD